MANTGNANEGDIPQLKLGYSALSGTGADVGFGEGAADEGAGVGAEVGVNVETEIESATALDMSRRRRLSGA